MKRVLSVAIALFTLGTVAQAVEPVYVTTKVVSDKPTVVLDPAMAYIYVRTETQMPLRLIRIADPQNLEVYAAARKVALEKEMRRYKSRVKFYESDLRLYEAAKSKNPKLVPPAKPVEPTDENFIYPAFEVKAGVSVGPLNRFAKGEKGASVYLQALTPGTYRIYGPVNVMPEGAYGTCFCMGSVKFDVRAGEIADLGLLRAGRISDDGILQGNDVLTPVDSTMAVDPRLAALPVKPAAYHPVGKLPNFYGVTVGRMQPIANVMAYDRDRIIDLTASSASSGLATGAR